MKNLSILEKVDDLRAALRANLDWEVQYLDVKYLNDLEAEYRDIVKSKIKAYRVWMKSAAKQRDVRVLAMTTLTGRAQKSSLDDYIEVWKTIRAERKFFTDVYVAQINAKRKEYRSGKLS
ncbi:MAG: hypothetical protein DI551_07930 [Micavibrio aeruginosavorus]|uniref:Uncharacterized protein n=1 Tax=Micavibrio aeruginosavorus TaxID=349221 RepID=A0A2W5MY07_9BACT|nr:MAG: hypothetical protein DI551_07930 [Micavibrio aeruginosavorus]